MKTTEQQAKWLTTCVNHGRMTGGMAVEIELYLEELRAELAEARKDDTELDATDAAKPAWWRGYDYGVAEICLAAFKASTGEEAKATVSWQVLKETIAARGAK